MNSLDDLMGATPSPVSLDEIVSTPLPSIPAPDSAIRNRAATIALASEPDKVLDNYQIMVAEGKEGKDDYTKYMKSRVDGATQGVDRASLMRILADPKASMVDKQNAITQMQTKPELKETSHTLYTNMAAQPAGETRDTEDARVNAVEKAIAGVHKAREERQAIVNAHGAGLRNAGAETLAEAAGYFVLPFGMNIAQAREVAGSGAGVYDTLKAFFAPGSSIKSQKEKLAALPVEERNAAVRNTLENLSKNGKIVFSDNQFIQFSKAQALLEEGAYTDVDVWLDNFSSLLDIVGAGGLLRGAARARTAAKAGKEADLTKFREAIGMTSSAEIKDTAKAVVNTEDIAKRMEINSSVRSSNPLSPHSIAKQSNPKAAADTFETIYKSTDDAVAEGLTGTSRTEALADDILPQAGTGSGVVSAQPADIQRNLRKESVPKNVWEFLSEIGRVDYTAAEKAAVRSRIVNDFKTAGEMSLHETMSSFESVADRISIRAVYGKADGAWTSAKDAREQAMLSLRKYGVLEDEVEILTNNGLDLVPIKYEDTIKQDGSYYVRINTEHTIDPTDVVKFEGVATKLNFLDRLPYTHWFQGGISSWVADAASRIDPKIYRGASVAQDYTAKLEKLLLDEAAKFTDEWSKLGKDGKARVDAYVVEANLKEIKFDPIDMKYRLGMSDAEISAIKKWREYWDAHYYLENADLIRTFNEQGYELFRTAQDEFHVKPIKSLNAVETKYTQFYDPATGKVEYIPRQDLDKLYQNGGNVARFRRPVDIDGTTVEHMVVRNTPTEYTRKFRDSDSVLNYREGYFTMHYDKPRFVDKIIKDDNGNEIRKTVAVGKDTPEVAAYVERANKNAPPDVRYEHRADDRALRRGSDDWFDIESARGRIAQRHRGQNLEDAAGVNHLGGMSYIESPVTSAVKAAKSIAGRTVTRPIIETAKERVKQQFAHIFPSDGMGGVKWPSSIDEIGGKGKFSTSEVADARTNWLYINYLENGYINGMDTVYKQFFFALSEYVGEKGLGKAQRALGTASEFTPSNFGKGAVFTATIASHPLRQMLVQSHQSVRVFAYNPKFFSGETFRTGWLKYMDFMNNGKSSKYANDEFVKFVDTSGVMDGVDKQNLVRGTLLDAAEGRGFFRKAVGTPLTVMRQIGFDLGERVNQYMSLAAVYDKYKRQGKNLLDPDIRAEAYAESRAVTWEMNFAGDMPYNHATPSVFLQFLQVPHKAFLQYLNRNLTWQEKLRFAAFDAVMWGPPIYAVNTIAQNFFGEDILPKDKKMREILTEGLEAHSFNQLFRHATKDDSIHIDFSSLVPYDYMGWAQMLYAFHTGGLKEMIAKSPAGTLFSAEEGRVRVAMRSMMRFFHLSDPVGQSPDDFVTMLNEVAKISSGWNNAQKAYAILEAKKRVDQYGRSNQDVVTAVEAFAQALGFGDADQKTLFELTKSVKETGTKYEEQVKAEVKDMLRYAQNTMQSGVSNTDQMNSVIQFALGRYQNNPVALSIVQRELGFALADPQMRILDLLIKNANLPGMHKTIDEIKMSNIPEDQKEFWTTELNKTRDIKE